MKSIPSLTGLVVMLASSCLAAADHTEGLSRKQFEQALRNVSTAPNYVLVTVIETNGDRRQPVCIEAKRLVSALGAEHGFKMEQAIRFALASKDRVFEPTFRMSRW